MATYIKTLKEDNGDITYPQTTTDAVLTTSGTTLETELGKCVKAEEIGSTADITPTITTAMIKDSAVTTAKLADSSVTSNKIDWTTFNTAYTSFLFNNSTITMPANTVTAVPNLTWTCPEAGGYVVLAGGNACTATTSDSYPRIGIYHNGSRVSYSAIKLTGSDQKAWSCIWYGSLTKGAIITVRSEGGTCILYEGQHMIVFRIN